MLGAYLMTACECYIDKPTFFDIVFGAIGDWDGVIPPPAILKPKELWTGRQLLSMIIPKMAFNAYKPPDMDNEQVCIRGGYICTGRFNKKILGKVERGLIHRMVHLEGNKRTAKFMSQLQFVVTQWLNGHSHSTGVEDCCTSLEVKKKVWKKLNDTVEACNYVTIDEDTANSVLNRVRDVAAKHVIDALPPNHGMLQMIKSGSKGSYINIAQISCCVGQNNVEGKRIATGNNNRTSSHYQQFSSDPIGRGFCINSYLTGLSPKEFFTRKWYEHYLNTLNSLLTLLFLYAHTDTQGGRE